jgi:cystinosin
LGFASYTISTAAFLYSPVIKRQYAFRHPYSPESTVRFNDLVFAAHGVLLCIITYSQFFPAIWGFNVSPRQRTSRFVLGVFWGCVLGVLATILMVRTRGSQEGDDLSRWAWIDTIYALGYVKIIAPIVKYCPQVHLNFRRKSTVGWSIGQILLDFIGGILSLLQLVIDSALQADWGGLTGQYTQRKYVHVCLFICAGNPVKLGLSNISMLFDVIFITQHYM